MIISSLVLSLSKIMESKSLSMLYFVTLCLSNDALRPSRLERHLTTARPTLKKNLKRFLLLEKNSMCKMELDSTAEYQQNDGKAVEASCHIALN